MEKKASCHSNSVFQGKSPIHFHAAEDEATLNSVLHPKDTTLTPLPPQPHHHPVLSLHLACPHWSVTMKRDIPAFGCHFNPLASFSPWLSAPPIHHRHHLKLAFSLCLPLQIAPFTIKRSREMATILPPACVLHETVCASPHLSRRYEI